MLQAPLNSIFYYKNELVQAVGIATDKVIFLRKLSTCLCPHCNKPIEQNDIALVESSPLFQENAKEIETLNKI